MTSVLQGQNIINASAKLESNSVSQKPYKTISFGDKIKLGKIEHSIVWTVLLVDSNIQTVLNGEDINNYIFEIPGTYQITFHENKKPAENECSHASFPESFIIKVSPIKMVFDFSTITFNKILEGGVNIENTELSINVNLKTYTNEPVVFSKAKIVAAGVETTISGQLVNDGLTLKVGNNKLVYKLTGSATKNSYIMLDFFDLNDQIQSYSYPTKL